MLFAMAACVALLFFGREDLGLRGILGIVALLLAVFAACILLNWPPVLILLAIVAVDIFMVLKVFGSDLRIN
jgi:uncharacterized protein YacL